MFDGIGMMLDNTWFAIKRRVFRRTRRNEEFMKCIVAKDILMTAIYLQQGVKINKLYTVKDQLGLLDKTTPLMLACIGGDSAMVELLLQNSANPNQRILHYKSPMHYCVKHGLTEILKIMLDNGGDPNLHWSEGLPLILYAVQNASTESAQILNEYGAFATRKECTYLFSGASKIQMHINNNIHRQLMKNSNVLSETLEHAYQDIITMYNVEIRP